MDGNAAEASGGSEGASCRYGGLGYHALHSRIKRDEVMGVVLGRHDNKDGPQTDAGYAKELATTWITLEHLVDESLKRAPTRADLFRQISDILRCVCREETLDLFPLLHKTARFLHTVLALEGLHVRVHDAAQEAVNVLVFNAVASAHLPGAKDLLKELLHLFPNPMAVHQGDDSERWMHRVVDTNGRFLGNLPRIRMPNMVHSTAHAAALAARWAKVFAEVDGLVRTSYRENADMCTDGVPLALQYLVLLPRTHPLRFEGDLRTLLRIVSMMRAPPGGYEDTPHLLTSSIAEVFRAWSLCVDMADAVELMEAAQWTEGHERPHMSLRFQWERQVPFEDMVAHLQAAPDTPVTRCAAAAFELTTRKLLQLEKLAGFYWQGLRVCKIAVVANLGCARQESGAVRFDDSVVPVLCTLLPNKLVRDHLFRGEGRCMYDDPLVLDWTGECLAALSSACRALDPKLHEHRLQSRGSTFLCLAAQRCSGPLLREVSAFPADKQRQYNGTLYMSESGSAWAMMQILTGLMDWMSDWEEEPIVLLRDLVAGRMLGEFYAGTASLVETALKPLTRAVKAAKGLSLYGDVRAVSCTGSLLRKSHDAHSRWLLRTRFMVLMYGVNRAAGWEARRLLTERFVQRSEEESPSDASNGWPDRVAGDLDPHYFMDAVLMELEDMRWTGMQSRSHGGIAGRGAMVMQRAQARQAARAQQQK